MPRKWIEINNLFNTLYGNLKTTEFVMKKKIIGDDETNFPPKLLTTDWQILSLCESFPNHSTTNVKVSKSKNVKPFNLGEFLANFLEHY